MFAPTQLKPELLGKFLVLNVTENSDTLFGSDAKSKLLNNSRQQPHAIPKGGDGSMSQNMDFAKLTVKSPLPELWLSNFR
jgi:hypothetical protein